MSVSDALWEIETAIRDSYDDPASEHDRRTAQCRRSIYEQTLAEVYQTAGTEAMYTLTQWIEREIRTAGRLPAGHEVRQIGAEISRRTTSARSMPGP